MFRHLFELVGIKFTRAKIRKEGCQSHSMATKLTVFIMPHWRFFEKDREAGAKKGYLHMLLNTFVNQRNIFTRSNTELSKQNDAVFSLPV